jgi:hypothetical protein
MNRRILLGRRKTATLFFPKRWIFVATLCGCPILLYLSLYLRYRRDATTNNLSRNTNPWGAANTNNKLEISDADANKVSLLPNRRSLKIHCPVLVASLFKSGTSSAHAYFECGHFRSAHNRIRGASLGDCLRKKINVSYVQIVLCVMCKDECHV